MGKSKHIQIELLNPSRSYLAGQIIHGRVIVQNEKPKKVKEVTILLEGSAKVHWTETERYTVHTTRVVNGHRKTVPKTQTRVVSYYADEKYVSQKISLVGDGHNLVTLAPGRTIYPFEFSLPSHIPSSFVSRIGIVSYFLEAEMRRPLLKPNNRDTLPFTVNGIYDLNLESRVMQAQETRRVKGSNWFACRKGQLGFVLKLPRRSGFVPGEVLDFSCEISNSSNRKVNGIKATLYQNVDYHARGKTKSEKKIVAQIKGSEVDPGEHEMWIPHSLRIPSLPPTSLGGVCRIINVQYVLKVEMKISGLSAAVSGKLPVFIGTIPLRATFDELRQLPTTSSCTLSTDGNAGSGMGFFVPQNSYSHPNIPGPSSSIQNYPAPSAPVFLDYPDLPPPSYAEAIVSERFFWECTPNQPTEVGSDSNRYELSMRSEGNEDIKNGNPGPSAPPLYSEFVPNYITYNAK